MEMDEATLEKYADWLDELERSNPDAYKNLMLSMKQGMEKASQSAHDGVPSTDNTASLYDMLKTKSAAATPSTEFKPRFPGDKIMETGGLKEKQDGMYIDVEPGFVMKTTDLHQKKKVFVNICFSDAIQTFSQQTKLDEEGKEQEGIHVPLSLGAPQEVVDKKGVSALAFDIAVNTQVVDDCKNDKTGAFRNFVCELAIEYIDQKYQIKLDARYKLPRLTYRGNLPPPKHYIRKQQKPMIQEVTKNPSAKPKTKPPKKQKETLVKTAHAHVEIVERLLDGTTRSCTRKSAVEPNGTALTPEILANAGTHLIVKIQFTENPNAIENTQEDLEMDLRPELVSIKARGYHDLSVFLPFPVSVDQVTDVKFDVGTKTLLLQLPIDKEWDLHTPDTGSAPWLLAHALQEESNTTDAKTKQEKQESAKQPTSLAEIFHLAMPSDQSTTAPVAAASQRMARWDPVDEDEELPEDRFHKKDMLSMHILDQRRRDREQKAKEADEKRRQKRKEVEEKHQKAKAAGKTWREMYPDEPETTYIDMEDLIQEQQAKTQSKHQEETMLPILTTEEAMEAAAVWSQQQQKHGTHDLDVASALAFELL